MTSGPLTPPTVLYFSLGVTEYGDDMVTTEELRNEQNQREMISFIPEAPRKTIGRRVLVRLDEDVG